MSRYIGARYVPILAGDWDNTNEYEPLTIVQYQGDSYTSKMYVPTGVAITNTHYWVKTANFNQQLAHMEDEWTNYQLDIERMINGYFDDNAPILDNAVRFPDLNGTLINNPTNPGGPDTRVVTTVSTKDHEFTAIEDCYVNVRVNTGGSDTTVGYLISGLYWIDPSTEEKWWYQIMSDKQAVSIDNEIYSPLIPVKAGTVLRFRALLTDLTDLTMDICVYKLHSTANSNT